MRDRQVLVLAIGAFLVMTGLTVVAPILPLYAREFGVGRAAAGVLISSFAVARLVFDVIGGVLADRFGARRVMTAGALLLAASSVGAALAPTYGLLLVTRVLEGIGSAAYATSANQLVVLITSRERLGRAMALYHTGILAGIAVGPIIGGYAAEIGDLKTPFWVYAALGIVVAGFVRWLIADVPTAGATMRQTYRAARSVMRAPAFRALMFVTFAIFVMRGGARITLIPLYAADSLGLDESEIGQVLAVSAVVNLFVVTAGGWLTDRVGRRPVLIVGLISTGVVTALYGFTNDFVSLVLVSCLFGLVAVLASIPPPTLAGDLAPAGAEGAAVGLYRAAGDFGLVVGPVLVGLIAEGGAFRAAFVTSGALLFVAALVTVWKIPEPTRGPALAHR